MSTTSAPVTIAGVQLDPSFPATNFDTANELELVSRLRKLPMKDFVAGMQVLTDYLNAQHQGLVVGRYTTLLVEMAGGEPDEDA